MNNVRCQSLFFISLPELRKLCAVKVTVDSHLAATEIRTAQRKMCRQLLLLHEDILSSPVPGTLNQISVIMTKSFYQSRKLQAYVEKHRAMMEMPERVIPALFQTCLSYTLIAKLAPEWNQAGHLLIQGKDFLSHRGKQNAVAMDINVSETQISISVEVYKIQLPPSELEDFNISENILKQFHSNNNASIQRFSIFSNWCYVLPSMKMGQITNISHKIPSDSPFQSYGDLQLHWKNLYGYVLPADPQPYCSIYFKPIGEHLFTYPFSCIRSHPVQFFPRVDLEAVLSAFITDLKTVIPHTCGFPLVMASKALYPTKDLTQSSYQKVNSKPVNLSVKKNNTTLLQETSNKYLFSCSACAPQNSHKMELQSNQLKFSTFTDSSLSAKEKTARAGEEKDYSRKQWENPKEPLHKMNDNETFKMTEHSLKKEPRKIIPIFKGKLLQMDRKTAKGGKNLTLLPKIFKATKTAKLAILNSSPEQIKNFLHDTSLQNTRNENVLKTQSGKIKVKSIKLGLKERNKDGEHLSNYALANKEGLGSNSNKTSFQSLNSFLIPTNHPSMNPVSAAQQVNKPPNTITHQTTLSTGSKKTHSIPNYLYMEEGNSRTFQIQNPPGETRMNAYGSSKVQKKIKKGNEKKPPNSLPKDTLKSSNHHLQLKSRCKSSTYWKEERTSNKKPKKLQSNKLSN